MKPVSIGGILFFAGAALSAPAGAAIIYTGTFTVSTAIPDAGDVATLSSWTLYIEGIPEPGSASLTAAAVALLLGRRRRNSGLR